MKPSILNQSGMSLIEAMVSIAIMSVMMFSMLTILDSQRRQLKGLSQKAEIMEIKSLMSQQLSKGDVCTWQLAGKTIDVSTLPTMASPSPTSIQIAELFQGPNSSSPYMARVNHFLPGSSSDLLVSQIQFKNIYATGSPNEYIGTFEIQFDESRLVNSLKPLQIQKLFYASSAGGTATITSCGGASLKPPVSGTFCATYSGAGCTDGKCPIPGSESALGCFLTAVDDDTARVDFAGEGGLPISTHPRVDVLYDSANQPKCEIQRDPGGWWWYRASMNCDLVACAYTCIFP